AYVSSFTAKGQFRDVLALANRPTALGTTLKAKDEVVKFFDQYMAGFEFTSRAAAFKIRKAEEVGKLMAKGMSRAEAEVAANKPAAAFAKGLANFEEKGLKGQQMGAWFMFFNASATGAVRVIEPLAPALSVAGESIKAVATLKLPFNSYQAAADRAWAELPTELRNKGNREEFNKKFIEQAVRGKNASAALFGFGVAMYYLAYAGAGEDDFGRNRVATDDMTRWQRDARFFVGDGVNDIITIPWGFGMGAFAALGAQIASLGNSDTKFTEVMANAVPILMDSFLPLPVSKGSIIEKPGEYIVDTIMPAPLRPIVEFAMNYNSLGQEIYNNRQGPNGSVYTGGDNIPKLFKDAAVFLYESTGFEFGPNEMYFFASAYADALSKAGSATWNIFTIGASDNRPAMERLKQDSLVLSGFIGTRSDYDARMWNKIEKDLDKRKDRLKEMEESNIEAYYNHLEENPLDEFLVEQYKGDANGELKKLRSEAKEIRRSSGYDFATKRDLLEANRVEQSLLKMQLVDMYKSMGYEF
ncbi:MAG: LPD38 domain-containing protein, partial [Cyanobacteriota bacterium]